MIAKLLSSYSLQYERTLSYMLQATEYDIAEFWLWWRSVKNFQAVSDRGGLVRTSFGKLLYAAISFASFVFLVISGVLAYVSIAQGSILWLIVAVAVFLLRPFLVTFSAMSMVLIGNRWYMQPLLRQKITEATEIFEAHAGVKIAVLGSYGKTTMKELLATVLGEGLNCAATPATKNVAISHAEFARSLSGDEAVVILEFGEGKPGDTKMFTDMFKPDYAVVTGLAPAHLNQYGTLASIASDFSYITNYVPSDKIYINGNDADLVNTFKGAVGYAKNGVGNWKVRDAAIHASGTTFTLTKKTKSISVASGLLGMHQVGPLAAVAEIADRLSVPLQKIESGLAKTIPFEHRMQPRHLGGALLIDDTYNGNIEGIKAGIALLRDLPAKRRIYVTPGLVEQGELTESVHTQIGELLAVESFDEIVLMKNAMTKFIEAGLAKAGYTGTVLVQTNPLEYYKNLEFHVAAGDVVMMQNDLPDRYAV